MAVQITGGERKRQDAPPVEPDAGKAGREVEPRGYGEMVHRADPPARPAGEYIRHHRPGSGERKGRRSRVGGNDAPRACGLRAVPRRASGVADGRGCSNGRGLGGATREGGRASVPVRCLTLDGHDAERK